MLLRARQRSSWVLPSRAATVACRGTAWVMSRLDRITSDPAICHGQPTVRGLRYPVESLLELLSSGMTIDQVLDDYPELERDDLLAALEFGGTRGGRRTYGATRRPVKFLVDAQRPARLARLLNDAWFGPGRVPCPRPCVRLSVLFASRDGGTAAGEEGEAAGGTVAAAVDRRL